MGRSFTLSEHNRSIITRIGDTRPIQPMIRKILLDGKREQLMAGQDSLGRKFAPLKPSTLKTRNGNGPPLIPGRTSSRFIARYFIQFDNRKDGVVVQAGWRDVPFLKYHRTGTKRMAKRDPGFFREKDRQAVGRILQDYILHGRV